MADFTVAQTRQIVPEDLDLLDVNFLITKPDPLGPVVITGSVSARIITADGVEVERQTRTFDELPAGWKTADLATWLTRWGQAENALLP